MRLLLLTLAFAVALAVPAQARPGDLDPAFGAGGRTAVTLGSGDAHVGGVALRPDGRVLLAGTAAPDPETVATGVLELAPSGIASAAFAHTGFALLDPVPGAAAQPAGLVLDGDGAAVVLTTVREPAEQRLVTHVVRVLPSGTLDPDFGTDGVARLAFAGGDVRAEDVALDEWGRVLVAASTQRDGRRYMSAFRLTEDGRLDSSFATDGRVDLDSRAFAGAILPRPGGGAYVAGGTLRAYGNIVVVEVNEGGRRLDRFAGGRAHVRLANATRPGTGAADMVAGPGGTLVIAANVRPVGARARVAVARITPRGRLDARFANRGLAVVASGTRGLTASAITRDSRGRLLVAGSARRPDTGAESALVLRLGAGGRVDRGFGRGGAVVQRLGGAEGARFVDSRATAVAVARGRIWVAGVAYDDEVAPDALTGRAWPALMRLRN